MYGWVIASLVSCILVIILMAIFLIICLVEGEPQGFWLLFLIGGCVVGIVSLSSEINTYNKEYENTYTLKKLKIPSVDGDYYLYYSEQDGKEYVTFSYVNANGLPELKEVKIKDNNVVVNDKATSEFTVTETKVKKQLNENYEFNVSREYIYYSYLTIK